MTSIIITLIIALPLYYLAYRAGQNMGPFVLELTEFMKRLAVKVTPDPAPPGPVIPPKLINWISQESEAWARDELKARAVRQFNEFLAQGSDPNVAWDQALIYLQQLEMNNG